MTTQPWPPAPTQTPQWYTQTWFTVLTLFFCFPVGIGLMWVYRDNWHIAIKAVVSSFFALFVISGLINPGSHSSDSASRPVRTASAVTAPLTLAQKQHTKRVAAQQAVQAKIAEQHQKQERAKADAQLKRQEREEERRQAEEDRQQAAEARRQEAYDQTHYKSDGLTLDQDSVYWGHDESGFASYITGKVTNDSGEDQSYAEISYKELHYRTHFNGRS